jgi:hypothetical protein
MILTKAGEPALMGDGLNGQKKILQRWTMIIPSGKERRLRSPLEEQKRIFGV